MTQPTDRAELAESLKNIVKGYAGEQCLPWEMVEESIDALARSTEPVAEIPPLPGHPESQVMRWSQLEEDAITRYGRACYEAGALARSTDAPSEPVAWWRWSYEDEDGGRDADVQIGTNKPTCLPENGYPWEPLYGAPLATPPAAQGTDAPSERSKWPIKPLDRVQVRMEDGTHVMAKAVFPYFDAASMQELEDRATPPAASASAQGEAKAFVKRAMQLADAFATTAVEHSRLELRCSRTVNNKLRAALKAHIETALAATTPAPACRAEPATDARRCPVCCAPVLEFSSTHLCKTCKALAAATDGGKQA